MSGIRKQRTTRTGHPFIGRRALLEQLRRDVYEKDAAELRPISLFGMPHVGKTSLLDALWEDKPENALVFLASPQVDFSYTLQSCIFDELFLTDSISDPEAEQIIADAYEQEDGLVLLERFHALVKRTTTLGFRVVLMLDEFDRILGGGNQNAKLGDGNTMPWTEEEYTAFVCFLLDARRENLNFVCVAVSRPRVESILLKSGYSCRLDPFVSRLVPGFSKEDMREYFQLLGSTGLAMTDADREELLYRCGRNPYLLADGALHPAMRVAAAGRPLTLGKLYDETVFTQQFHDVLDFMLQEEDTKERSFSHIVKCYFNPSPDYRDIQERFIGLGYLELLDPEDREVTYQPNKDKFVYEDIDEKYLTKDFTDPLPEGRNQYTYITLSPQFIDSFYTAKTPDKSSYILDHVKDAKDLLAGLIYTLRDISDREMRKAGCVSCAWRDTCLQRECAAMAGSFGETWGEKVLLHCLKTRYKGRYSKFVREEAAGGGVRFSAQALAAGENRTLFFGTPSEFLLGAFNDPESPTPLLDPINLKDQGSIFKCFSGLFSKYFGCFGGLNVNKKCEKGYPELCEKNLDKSLEKLKTARDKIAHYSRTGLTKGTQAGLVKICRELLRSIYTQLNEGTPFAVDAETS